jgi:hypothetical protein
MKFISQLTIVSALFLGASAANAATLLLDGAPTFGVIVTNLYHDYRTEIADAEVQSIAQSGCSSGIVLRQGRDFASQLRAGLYDGRNVTGVVVKLIEVQNANGATLLRQKVDCFIPLR